MSVHKLYLSIEVPGNTIEGFEFTPPDTKTWRVYKFHGDAGYDLNAAVRIDWDPSGLGESIWSVKGKGGMPPEAVKETERMGDGVKKVALCLDNGTAGPIFMSGTAWIEVDEVGEDGQ